MFAIVVWENLSTQIKPSRAGGFIKYAACLGQVQVNWLTTLRKRERVLCADPGRFGSGEETGRQRMQVGGKTQATGERSQMEKGKEVESPVKSAASSRNASTTWSWEKGGEGGSSWVLKSCRRTAN